MPTFASVAGNLSYPTDPHPPDPKYKSVGIGKPLCVEILAWSFGNVKDWWGKSEILSSSWAKLGGTAVPGPRIVNLMKKQIAPFTHFSSIGADSYGHRLIFYTPSYGGQELRISLEYLEIDKLGKDGIATLTKALNSYSTLPIFAPQLPFLALAPQAVKIAGKLYELFNKNDTVLLEKLDLRHDDPDFNRLTSGRYVVVAGQHNPGPFIQKFKLNSSHRLVTKSGQSAKAAGLNDAYIVIRVNAKKYEMYKNFEQDSTAQAILDEALNHGITKSIADTISDAVKAKKDFDVVKKIMVTKQKLDEAETVASKKKLKADIENLIKFLTDTDQISIVRNSLHL